MRRRLGDEIGRRSGLKIRGREACGFESRPGHQPGQPHVRNEAAFACISSIRAQRQTAPSAEAPIEHGPVNANEIAIYAVETRAIIHILWGLLLIAAISLIGVSITYVLLRIKLRSAEKRERQLARHIGIGAAEIKRLEERLASRVDLEAQIAGLKAQLHRAPAVRAKLEARSSGQDADYRDARQAA